MLVPAFLVHRGNGDFAIDIFELGVQIDANRLKVVVHPEPVSGANCRSPAKPDGVHQNEIGSLANLEGWEKQ
jgi:hypothetical protein